MNTLQLAWLDGWDEDEMAAEVAGFVQRKRRLPDYGELVALRRAPVRRVLVAVR